MEINLSMKVIIWGFPLYSHTHSYVHYGWRKAFKSLGYETYWFHDGRFPADFDYSNCLFITEGYADNNIPLNSGSTYFVHMCRNPSKYLDAGCRLIDIRFNVKGTKDFTYDYVLDKSKCQQLDSVTFYERNASDLALREKYRKNISGYEAVYTTWATDMLPSEFNFDDMRIIRERKVWYIGSLWSANRDEIGLFKKACENNGVEFINNDPWNNYATVESHKDIIQRSYIAPDIRGSGVTCGESTPQECNHLEIGYIPCRTFKNISYGQIGATNSKAVNDLFGGRIVYNSDPYALFADTDLNSKNYSLIREQMEYVKENHTFINRANCFLELFNNKI
jgi:hypothetical protein